MCRTATTTEARLMHSERDVPTGHEGVFGVPATNVLTNILDVASHYPYNPERWRLTVDGSRVFPEYGAVSQYNHAGPHHELIPAQGETVVMQTAERPRYAVGFEQVASLAFSISRSLETGDQVRVGLFDDNDGWFLEHNPSHNDDQVDLVVRDATNGDQATSNISLDQAVTNFERYELRTAWYRVTGQLWRQSVVAGASQKNKEIGRTHKETGPEVGNLPMRFEITRGTTSAITMDAGSCALLTQGNKTGIRRVKTHEVQLTTDANADGATWFPQYALRIDPDRSIVDTQISSMTVQAYGGAGDVRCFLSSHAPSNVLKTGPSELADSDFSVPAAHMGQNSVLEETDGSTVTQAADSTGATTTSTSDPGGYQVGYASLHGTGSGSSGGKAQDSTSKKRGLYGGDYAVLWIRADNSNVDVQVNITTEQDW